MESGLLIRTLVLRELFTQHLLRALKRHAAIDPGTDRHEHNQPNGEIHEKFFGGHSQLNAPAGCSNRMDFSAPQPWRAGTRLVPSQAVAGPRTTLAACFNILRLSHMRWDPQPQPAQIPLAGSRNYRTVHKPDPLPDRNNYGSNETGHAVRSLAG